MKTFKETPKQSVKLRELIERVKSCKTMEEEKKLITRECADIRNTMPENQFKTRNVMKLIYLDLLGYNTQFAQIECLALISSHEFQTKRIGYLALGLLLDENQETLTLVINHLQKDLESDNHNIIGLALTTIANIGSEEMCQVISPYVLKTFNSPIKNVQRKAVAAALRIIKKCPNLIDQYINPIIGKLNTCGTEFILPITQLALNVVEHSSFKHSFDSTIPTLVSALNKNVRGSATDVALQACICCNILSLIRKIYIPKHMQIVEDVLADIIVNSPRNSIGICVGFAASQCSLEIECDELVKEMGINYLIRLIYDESANTRYAAFRYIENNIHSIWKLLIPYTLRILECLEDEDDGIKLFSLHISAELARHGSQKEIVQHIISSLGEGKEFSKEASKVVCDLVELIDAEPQWKFDCLLDTALTSGSHINENITQRLISIISLYNIQTYAITKLYPLMRTPINPIKKVAVWAVGEYFDIIKNVIKEEMIIKEIVRCNCDNLIKIVALGKIASRGDEEERRKIGKLVEKFQGGHSFEENQRYSETIEMCIKGEGINGWGRMPIFEECKEFGSERSKKRINVKKIENEEQINIIGNEEQNKKEEFIPQMNSNNTLLDFNNVKESKNSDLLFNTSKTSNVITPINDIFGFNPSSTQSKPSKYDILGVLNVESKPNTEHSPIIFDLVGSDTTVSNEQKEEKPVGDLLGITQEKLVVQESNNDEDDFEFTEYIPPVSQEKVLEVYSDGDLNIIFKVKRNGDEYNVVTVFANKSDFDISNIQLKVASPKGISIDIKNIDKSTIKPNENTTELFTTKGNSNGNVPVKVKVEYVKGNEQKVIQSTPILLNY